MSYFTQSLLAEDQAVLRRTAACAALEGIPDPQTWAWGRAWQLSAQPGWDAAFASALAAELEDPGRDESVISDHMILSAVQTLSAPTSPA